MTLWEGVLKMEGTNVKVGEFLDYIECLVRLARLSHDALEKGEGERRCAEETRRKDKSEGVSGEANPAAKLTQSQVDDIRALHSAGRTSAYLGGAYGVSEGAIRSIVKMRTWARQ